MSHRWIEPSRRWVGHAWVDAWVHACMRHRWIVMHHPHLEAELALCVVGRGVKRLQHLFVPIATVAIGTKWEAGRGQGWEGWEGWADVREWRGSGE